MLISNVNQRQVLSLFPFCPSITHVTDSSNRPQAFAGALTVVLKDYYIFVAQLEKQFHLGQLTLNKVRIWSLLENQKIAGSLPSMGNLLKKQESGVNPTTC
jgi:hypothetical protein